MDILGDEDEASQWKDTNGISDIHVHNDEESEQDVELQEVRKIICNCFLKIQVFFLGNCRSQKTAPSEVHSAGRSIGRKEEKVVGSSSFGSANNFKN